MNTEKKTGEQSDTEKNTSTLAKDNTTGQEVNFDYSKAEEIVRNIELPGSNFKGKWIKDSGYAIGLENHRLTRFHETLNEALEEIGYEVEKDRDGDEILKRKGKVNWEHVVNIVRILLTVQHENNSTIIEETIKKLGKEEATTEKN